MSVTGVASEETSLTDMNFTGKAVKNWQNPMFQMLYACNCLWSTTLGHDLYADRFSDLTRKIVRVIYNSRVKYWHWIVEVFAFFVIGGPPVYTFFMSGSDSVTFDSDLWVEIVCKFFGSLLTVYMFAIESFSIYIQHSIFHLPLIGLCWRNLPGNITMEGLINNFLEYEVSQVRSAGIIAETDQAALVARCQTRRITRFTIMLYNDKWKGKFCFYWNIFCTLARVALGAVACVTPYTSSAYQTCISLYYLVVGIDFLYAWYFFCVYG
jgi:hypothetical protein